MRLNRIMAIVVTHCMQYAKLAEWIEIFFFWVSSVLVFGFLGKSVSATAADSTIGFLILFGAIAARPAIMQAPRHTADCITTEAAGRTLVATLATPISFLEWTCATIIVGFVGIVLRWVLSCLFVFFFFNLSPWLFVQKIFLIFIPLLFSTFVLSLFLSAFSYVVGKNGAQFLRMLSWSFGSFCGTWCPVAALPLALQKIAWFLPMTYIFEGLRTQMTTGASIWPSLAISIIMSIGYLIPALLFLYFVFKRTKKLGLSHLEAK